MEVLERVGLETFQQGDQTFATTLPDKVVASVEQRPRSDTQGTLVEPESGLADDSYHFSISLPLKKSLNSCRQSVNTPHIKVHHNLKIYVNIHNPDGHVSQLCLRNLIHIYISPHMHIGDDQSVTTDLPQHQLIQTMDPNADPFQDAPPIYGTHILDQLYQDIDPSGFVSGYATPMPYLTSRNVSSDDLSMFQAPSDFGLGVPVEEIDNNSSRSSSSIPDSAAVQLQSRLAALEDRRPSISSVIDIAYDSSGQPSPRLDHQESETLEPISVDLSTLSGLPPLPLSRPESPDPTRQGVISNQSLMQTPPANRLDSNAYSRPLPLSNGNGITPTLPSLSRNTRPESFEFNPLLRVPSYATAIRTPPLAAVSFEGGEETLPSYEESERQDGRDLQLGRRLSGQPTLLIPNQPPVLGPVTLFDSTSTNRAALRRSSQPFLTPVYRGSGSGSGGGGGGGADVRPAGNSLLAPPQRAHVRGRSLGRVGDLNSDRPQSHLRTEIRPSPVDETAPPLENVPQIGLQRYVRPSTAMGGGSLASLWGRRGSH
jgi:hypothetical protein